MSSIMSTSTRNDSITIEDCSPISQACIKALTDRLEGKRKLAATEIEKMTCEFSLSNNHTMINRLIIVLGRKFCLSTSPNARKGGLLGLAAVMVGFKNGSMSEPPAEIVEEVIRPILTCFQDSDTRVRYYACESLYNVTKVAGASILPLFREIFDNMSKIVADIDIGVRSGAEVLDKLLKDIVVEQETFDAQAFVPKLEEYIYTKNPFTRMFILSWIRLLDSKIDMIYYLPQLLDGIFNCLDDPTEAIRASTLNLLSDFLNKIRLKNAESELILSTSLQKKLFQSLLDILAAKSDAVVKNALRVITDLFCFDETYSTTDDENQQVPSTADNNTGAGGVPQTAEPISPDNDSSQSPPPKEADDAINIASDLDKRKSPVRTNLRVSQQPRSGSKKVAISPAPPTTATSSKNDAFHKNNANVLRFIRALCKMFREKNAVFEERGTFIIINLCIMVPADIIYKSFAEILKDERTDLKFAFNMVQKLNRILLTTQPLFALRSRLSSANSTNTSDIDDIESNSIFLSLYYAWCHSPIAVLTLCLLTNNYKHANEIVLAISQTDINVDVLTQIDWVVQLIESPVFAALRMKLLDVNSNQYLLQSLYGLLMILPQSEAFTKLAHRLDQVHKFMSAQPHFATISSIQQNSSSSSHSNTKPSLTTASSSKDVKKIGAQADRTSVETLMKHYNNIQNQRSKLGLGVGIVASGETIGE